MKIVEITTVDEHCNGYLDYEVKATDTKDIEDAQSKLVEMVQNQFNEYEIGVAIEADSAEHSIDEDGTEAVEGNLYRVNKLDKPSATEPVAVLQIEERGANIIWFLVD